MVPGSPGADSVITKAPAHLLLVREKNAEGVHIGSQSVITHRREHLKCSLRVGAFEPTLGQLGQLLLERQMRLVVLQVSPLETENRPLPPKVVEGPVFMSSVYSSTSTVTTGPRM